MPSHSSGERSALADALAAAGPGAQTLCAGWTTTELAVHVVVREGRMDAGLAALVPGLSGWSRRVHQQQAARPYGDLVEALRTGPPRTSPMAIHAIEARLNLAEYFVHCEDVRRARLGWQPRELPPGRQATIWSKLATVGGLVFRRSPVPVQLRTPDGRTHQVTRSGSPADGIVLVGDPGELLLYGFGRKDHARVFVEGPDESVTAFREVTFAV